MAWGDKSERIIAMLKESGQTDASGDRPAYEPTPVLGHLGFYLDSFWSLANHEGIPFADLDRYAARYGIEDVDDFDRFATLLRRLNGVWAKAVMAPDKVIDNNETTQPKPRAKVI